VLGTDELMGPNSGDQTDVEAELALARARFEEIANSKSWRYTAPLRAAMSRLRPGGAPVVPQSTPASAPVTAPAAPSATVESAPTAESPGPTPEPAPLVERMEVMEPSGLGAALANLGPEERAAKLAAMPRSELLEIAKGLNWIHDIDLGDGFVTPGIWGPQPAISQALDAIDFEGKRVLDIGCWDGGYSFAAERLGASLVYATDLVTERAFAEQPTLEVARALLGSSVQYRSDMSVYDLAQLDVRDFDVVIFAGVYYHLKHPILALEAIRSVMRLGGTVLVEGAIDDSPGCYASFYHYKDWLGDGSNWWVPTVECLQQWVTCSGFRIEREFEPWGYPTNPRHTMLATAVTPEESELDKQRNSSGPVAPS
jgi:tRNA (mo5U34)-methyltransferase